MNALTNAGACRTPVFCGNAWHSFQHNKLCEKSERGEEGHIGRRIAWVEACPMEKHTAAPGPLPRLRKTSATPGCVCVCAYTSLLPMQLGTSCCQRLEFQPPEQHTRLFGAIPSQLPPQSSGRHADIEAVADASPWWRVCTRAAGRVGS